MKGRRRTRGTFSAVLAIALALGTSTARPSVAREAESLSALWEQPQDLRGRDLFYGPWGAAHAPDPRASYTFIRPKEDGTNPGVVVQDPLGQTWHVKQPSQRWAEGPPEVVLSRVLSAVGYHQPPVYLLPSFTMTDASGAHIEPGGRFRLEHESLTEQGNWSWRMNPFVGTPPYQGLLVILLMFASTDLKNSNNTLYEVARDGGAEQWYVVRDLGGALGEYGLFRPMRNDAALFEVQPFITGVAGGFVDFDHPIKQRMLIKGRITPNEVAWASNLLAGLSDRQWHDAFRAGGYEPDVAARFIRKLRLNIAHGQQLSSTHARSDSTRADERFSHARSFSHGRSVRL
ncbi:MAG TPA: hypothetical protein VIK60_01995 [Vicinamibacterales bacterium]